MEPCDAPVFCACAAYIGSFCPGSSTGVDEGCGGVGLVLSAF